MKHVPNYRLLRLKPGRQGINFPKFENVMKAVPVKYQLKSIGTWQEIQSNLVTIPCDILVLFGSNS